MFDYVAGEKARGAEQVSGSSGEVVCLNPDSVVYRGLSNITAKLSF